jgi:transposase-like protein
VTEPTPTPPAPACPFCEAADTERVGLWGGQMITSQWRCRACGSYFEAVREELGEAQVQGEVSTGT